MVFLCGLFFPIAALPFFLRPVAYILPLTYGADILHGAINHTAQMSLSLNLLVLAGFCGVLFLFSIRNIRQKWIY
jgi:ABC-2 type transport system permease protein